MDFKGLENNEYKLYGKILKVNGKRYYIQFPKEINSDTVFYVAGRGSAGVGDTKSTFNAAKGKNVVVIAPLDAGMADYENAAEVIDQIAKHYNIGQPNTAISGHSLTGLNAMRGGVAYVKKFNVPTCIVLNDPYCYGNDKTDYSVLKGSLILDYAPSSGGCTKAYLPRLKKAAQAGAKVILCYYNNDHGASDEVAAMMGTYDMAHLQFMDSGPFVKSNGKTYNGVFTYKYIDSNGNIRDFKNAAEAQAYLDEALIEITGSLYDKFSELSDFAEHYKGKGDTLGSDLSFVSNCMHGIKNKITSHTDINYTKASDNEAGVISAMYASSNYYGAVTNILYGNLSAETDAVYAIANAIYKMDGVASLIAETSLTDSMRNLYSTSNPTVSAELEKLKKTTSELYDTAKNAITANGRYDELTNILGTKPESGNVGKISISSLESAINAIVPNLENEVNKANSLKSGVSEFMSGIGASNILQGGVWDDVKTNMANYENLLDCNAKAATFISDTIKTAMGLVVDYIQSSEDEISAMSDTKYSGLASANELDDSKLPEIIAALKDVETKIEELTGTITEMRNATVQECKYETDTEGVPHPYDCKDVPKYTAAEIAVFETQLEEANNLKKTLDNYKGILEGLSTVVSQAQQIISDAISQVKSMYENPVKDADGNQRFVADFKLDLSAYGINSEKDYKKIIDDYYEKLNPKTEPPTTASTPTEAPADEWEGGGPTGPGTPSVPTTPATDAPTEAPTEKPTETPTESETEPSTEESTEEPTESPTEIPSEMPTEVETDVPVTPTEAPTSGHGGHGGHGGGGSDKKPPKPGVETEPIAIDIPTEVETIPWEVEPETDPDIYYEPEIETDVEIEIPPEEILDIQPAKKNNGLKVMGIAAGVGLAVGAAALGAHTVVKNKDEDDDEDYGYEK